MSVLKFKILFLIQFKRSNDRLFPKKNEKKRKRKKKERREKKNDLVLNLLQSKGDYVEVPRLVELFYTYHYSHFLIVICSVCFMLVYYIYCIEVSLLLCTPTNRTLWCKHVFPPHVSISSYAIFRWENCVVIYTAWISIKLLLLFLSTSTHDWYWRLQQGRKDRAFALKLKGAESRTTYVWASERTDTEQDHYLDYYRGLCSALSKFPNKTQFHFGDCIWLLKDHYCCLGTVD